MHILAVFADFTDKEQVWTNFDDLAESTLLVKGIYKVHCWKVNSGFIASGYFFAYFNVFADSILEKQILQIIVKKTNFAKFSAYLQFLLSKRKISL